VRILRAIEKLSPRERFLLVGILGVAVGWWGLSLLGRFATDWRVWRQVSGEVRQAEQDLEFGPEIEERLRLALADIDTSALLDTNEFVELVDQIAREADLPPNIDRIRTREGEGVRLHSLFLRFRSLTVEELIRVENLLRSQSPYIQIESVSIRARSGAPELSADFSLTAFEVDSIEDES